jgi:tetratricopeptide (TPR) repeat protein
MTKLSLLRWFGFLLGICLLASNGSAQTASIQIQPDVRVFAVLAALQEAGLEANTVEAYPNRAVISREFQGLPAELRAKLRTFYQGHMDGKKAEDQAAKYISLALLTESPPEFKLMLAPNQLPPDAFSVREFLDLVKEFYAAGKVEAVWSRHRARYDQAVVEYQPTINQIILVTDGYLRIASGSFLDRQFFIIPDFLAPPNAFNARTYRDNYYLVFGPAGKLAIDEFRHQYLHFLLDPYALRFTLARDKRSALLKFMETTPRLDDPYRNDLQFVVTESLIRAVELRMKKVPEGEAAVELDSAVRGGAVLAKQLYRELQTFEASPEGIRIYYPTLMKNIEIDSVPAAFAEAQKNAPPPQIKAEPRELSTIEKLLRQANVNLAANNLEAAVEQFQHVIESDADNGEALYGLGLVASMKNKREIAADYFSKAVQSPTTDKSVKVWAHIYLGRLLDVDQKRAEALHQYQSAVALGDNTRNAQDAAQRGLREPFSARKTTPLQ